MPVLKLLHPTFIHFKELFMIIYIKPKCFRKTHVMIPKTHNLIYFNLISLKISTLEMTRFRRGFRERSYSEKEKVVWGQEDRMKETLKWRMLPMSVIRAPHPLTAACLTGWLGHEKGETNKKIKLKRRPPKLGFRLNTKEKKIWGLLTFLLVKGGLQISPLGDLSCNLSL